MADYTATVQFPLRLGITTPELGEAYIEAAHEVLGDLAEKLQNWSVQRLRKNTPVLSGALRASAAATRITRVGAHHVGFKFRITSGDRTTKNVKRISYPQFVEYGTVKMSPRFYMSTTAKDIRLKLDVLLQTAALMLVTRMALSASQASMNSQTGVP